MKLIISSRDFKDPVSAKGIYDNLGVPIEKCRVLFFANEHSSKSQLKGDKFKKRLEAYGFSRENIFVFNYYEPEPFYNLDIDAVFIGPGNTFATMMRIRRAGFDKAIVDYVKGGAVYIGSSAGAHIASPSMAHAVRYDPDTYGVTDFSGLGLCDRIFICHFGDERRAHYEELVAEGKYPVTALANDEYIVLED